MEKKYEPLFEYTKIGNMGLSNRFVMAPMTTLASLDFSVADELIDYYEARARGGVGLIILEGQPISPQGIDPAVATPIAGSIAQKRQWLKFVNRLRGYGSKLCVQLICGAGRNAMIPGVKMVSASQNPLWADCNQHTRALTIEEIQSLIKSFAFSAAMAKSVGFDAVEIHGHTGYLMDQFISGCWNHRTDQYGGSFENRLRFPIEVISEVRKSVGPDFPILFRFSVSHRFPGGRTYEEGLKIIKALDEAGVDAFDIDEGSYEAHEWIFPPSYYGDACMAAGAKAVKSVTKKPVLNTGNYTPETAADCVANGVTDYVMLGRGLVADPDFVNKIYEGRVDDIRPCLRCNEYCVGYVSQAFPISCSVNMQAGAEKTFVLTKTSRPKTVVVVGGGPAGLEAARIAALSGHRVKIFEKSHRLGGQVIAAATPPFKSQLKKYLEYLIMQVINLNVDIQYGVEITPDSPELKNADEIILAMGATPIKPRIQGVGYKNVIEVTEAHTKRHKEIGEWVVVAGGGLSGCDCALELAIEGKNVTIVEMLNEVAQGAQMDNRLALMKKLDEYNVTILTAHKVNAIGIKSVMVEDKSGLRRRLLADTAIIAFGMKSCRDEAEKIIHAYPHAKNIGDSCEVGQVGDAVRAGFLAGWAIR